LEVLNRIPSIVDSHNIARNVDNSLLEILEVRWFGNLNKKPRGQKIPAGQSYSAQESGEEDDVEVPSQNGTARRSPARRRRQESEDEKLPDLHPVVWNQYCGRLRGPVVFG
jgi:hypothetical protein